MNYKLSTIASILSCPISPLKSGESVSILLTDSRALTDPGKSIFFAIKTSGNDGHRYILDLYDRGVRNFVVEQIPPVIEAQMDRYSSANFFKVPSPKVALQAIARYHRMRFDIPVVGITGSAGKTMVKEWLYQALHHDFSIVRSPRSFNSQIGVPLSVWSLTPRTTLGIFEAGISQHGEMEALASIIKPTVGVITSLTEEHDEGFDSRRQKCVDKVKLFRDCEYVVYNADDRLIASVISETCRRPRKIGWSSHDSTSPLYISSMKRENGRTLINFKSFMGRGEISVPFTSDTDIEDVIHTLAVMLCLQQPVDYTTARLSGLTHVDTRLSVIEGVNNCMLVFDTFTPDLPSLSIALDFMNRRQTANRNVTVILSDLQHDNCDENYLYEGCARMLLSKGVSRVIGIGPEFMRYSSLFDAASRFYNSTADFLGSISPGDFNNEFILIKGAYRFHFDKLGEILEARHQESVLEVNLDSIVYNFNHFRSLLAPHTGIVGMVKANAYGAGSLEVAKTLQSQGADYLAVALLDEGVSLRQAGVSMPIMVLNPRVLNYRTLFTYNLEPEIYNFDILAEVIAEGRKWGVSDYPIHLKLDTGMHRLGFIEEEITELINILTSQKTVRVESVFSHLSSADDPEKDVYTMMQFEKFDRCYNRLSESLDYYIQKHILNTAGITRFASLRPDDDLVRLGIGLYGIDPINPDSTELRPVSSLTTIITSLRSWPAGVAIGYSRRGELTRPSRIATLPIGYADGLNRHLGNGNASFLVNGHLCPTVGNICMDSCMIDVTDAKCTIGDTVEIFGCDVSVNTIAATLDTIPYEVLTSVSDRIKRIYFRE